MDIHLDDQIFLYPKMIESKVEIYLNSEVIGFFSHGVMIMKEEGRRTIEGGTVVLAVRLLSNKNIIADIEIDDIKFHH